MTDPLPPFMATDPDIYEHFMGRWSASLAKPFLEPNVRSTCTIAQRRWRPLKDRRVGSAGLKSRAEKVSDTGVPKAASTIAEGSEVG
jgi:hypothetical protein